jgi:hypothetical protein
MIILNLSILVFIIFVYNKNMKTYYIYIMTNKYDNVLFVGVTNDLYDQILK